MRHSFLEQSDVRKKDLDNFKIEMWETLCGPMDNMSNTLSTIAENQNMLEDKVHKLDENVPTWRQ